MMTIYWRGQAVSCKNGDLVGAALARAGIRDLGPKSTQGRHTLFCGIGQCQNCLVQIAGRPVEACLAPCTEGLRVEPVEAPDAR